ncbi:hypothetical protein [Telmatospirillum siberiense]|uniref:hypothetical protein n=1 Tax=Telmatospirillum siberiense TaxID=382514 RepID=UPI0011AF950D|nr:hypothetical protein [Telmatospirillum siberiense]
MLVVGGSLSEHLAGLAHHGCGVASGIHPGALCLHHESADVIWLIDPLRSGREIIAQEPKDFGAASPAPEIGGPIRALLHRIGDPRLLAILLPADERAWVQNFLYRLGANGLVLWSYHPYGERLVVTASRPGWLRGVSSNRRAGL